MIDQLVCEHASCAELFDTVPISICLCSNADKLMPETISEIK